MQEDLVALSSTLAVPEHRTVEYKSDYVFVGEGPDEESAIRALKQMVSEHYANAILDYKLTVHQHKFSQKKRYVATGLAAMVDGERYKMQNGRHISIDKKLLRVNSPNAVQIRYLTVLLISLLFIAVPSLVRVAQRLNFSAQSGLIASLVLAVLGLALLLCFFPNRVRFYLVAARRRNSI